MRLGRWLSYRRSGKQKPGEARGLQLRRNRPENLRNLRNLRISCPVRARYARRAHALHIGTPSISAGAQ